MACWELTKSNATASGPTCPQPGCTTCGCQQRTPVDRPLSDGSFSICGFRRIIGSKVSANCLAASSAIRYCRLRKVCLYYNLGKQPTALTLHLSVQTPRPRLFPPT